MSPVMKAEHQTQNASCLQGLFAAGLRAAAKRPADFAAAADAVATALAEPCDCEAY